METKWPAGHSPCCPALCRSGLPAPLTDPRRYRKETCKDFNLWQDERGSDWETNSEFWAGRNGDKIRSPAGTRFPASPAPTCSSPLGTCPRLSPGCAHRPAPSHSPLPATATVVPPLSLQRESVITPVSCSKRPQVPGGLGRVPPPRVFRNPGSQGAEVVAEGLCTGKACGSFSLCPHFNQKSSVLSYLYIVFYLKKRILWLKKNNLKTTNR